jgi:hypothetical protein
MKRQPNNLVILTLAFALLATVVLAAGEPGEEQPAMPRPGAEPTGENEVGRTDTGAPGAAGLRVYLDPETGELTGRPADPETETEGGLMDPRQRLNTYGRDLLQERIESGGFKVDLRGRFQSAVVATIDPETDTVSIECVPGAVVEATDEEEADHDHR